MIGIFDSGSGGLTVLRALKESAPNADVVYFGDIKHAPYGNRSREEIGALMVLGFQRLIREGATEIIAACNTVTASVVVPMLDIAGIPRENVIDMISPTAHYMQTRGGRSLIAATRATIDSGLYQQAFEEAGVDVVPLAIPTLAGEIERGASEGDLRELIISALKPMRTPFDSLILGCTHYPLVEHIFWQVIRDLGRKTEIIDPSVPVARQAAQQFNTSGQGTLTFIISADSAVFRNRVAHLFPSAPYQILVGS